MKCHRLCEQMMCKATALSLSYVIVVAEGLMRLSANTPVLNTVHLSFHMLFKLFHYRDRCFERRMSWNTGHLHDMLLLMFMRVC